MYINNFYRNKNNSRYKKNETKIIFFILNHDYSKKRS